MNPWIILGAIGIGVIFGIDFLLRRKKWSENTELERKSLIFSFCCIPVYLFAAALGLFWGITGSSADTAFGEVLYNITLTMASFTFAAVLAAAVLSLVFRKLGKTKASIWASAAGLAYIFLSFGLNALSGLF